MERRSGVMGVTWQKIHCEWRVQAKRKGHKIHRHFTARTNTPEDIEHARLAAIKCLDDWKRKICKAGSPRNVSSGPALPEGTMAASSDAGAGETEGTETKP